MRDTSSYSDPEHCPSEPPRPEGFSEYTRRLHGDIDGHARSLGEPVLTPDGDSVSYDLFSSQNIVAWQERKSEAVFSDDDCWAELLPIYGRYGQHALQRYGASLATLYDVRVALATCSGMTAVSTVLESFVEPGSEAVLVGQVYNKTRSLLETMTERLGGRLHRVAYNDVDALKGVLDRRTALVMVETFTNPHMRALDLAGLRGALTKHPQTLLVVDDTIATPWGPRHSLLGEGGADIVVGSGTKALAGNDSATSGYIVSGRAELLNACMNTLATRGGLLDARTAEALLAGLETAEQRHQLRCDSASEVASFLAAHPRVGDVYHPSLADHPDRNVIERDYARTGSLLSFRLSEPGEDVAKAVCDALAYTGVFRYALSFDGLVSKVNHHRSVSEYFTPEEVCRASDLHGLIRLGIGTESSTDLIACLNWALWHGASLDEAKRAEWERERRQTLGLPESFEPGLNRKP